MPPRCATAAFDELAFSRERLAPASSLVSDRPSTHVRVDPVGPVVRSGIGRLGRHDDNGLAESFVDSFKSEVIKTGSGDREQLEFAVVVWIGWFNLTRQHEALGHRRAAEFGVAARRHSGIVIDGAVTASSAETAKRLTTRGRSIGEAVRPKTACVPA